MLTVKGIYSDGMVLQRNTTNCIFGSGDKGAKVTLNFRDQKIETVTDSSGNWKIEYNPGKEGGPFAMDIHSGGEKIQFSDVYVGEVWVSSGQSNAQLPMERMKFSYPEEFDLPTNNHIRMITVPISFNFEGEQDSVVNPEWKCASPKNIGSMSGTAYFFAKKLSQDLGVPVGVINASQGGSPISAWMSKKSLEELGDKQHYLTELSKWENLSAIKAKQESMALENERWNSLISGADEGNSGAWEQLSFRDVAGSWEDVQIPSNIPVEKAGIIWLKKEINLTLNQVENFNAQKTWLWLGTILDADRVYVNGLKVGETFYCYPPRRYEVPAGTLVEGSNTITIRVQKNSKNGPIRFYEEKPYCLFTADVPVSPVAFRNVEVQENADAKSLMPGSELIKLDGIWKMKKGCELEDAPSGMFFEWVPTALYNAMLSPAFNYAVAGALWYQGESDAGHYEEYKQMLVKLISLWRQKFKYAKNDMPFVVVQLPNWSDGWDECNAQLTSEWASLRQEQLLAVELAGNAGLAVTIDAGEWNDLHPEKKYTAGTRSAMEALRIAYNKNYTPSPKAIFTKRMEEVFIVQFDCGGSKLVSLNPALQDYVPGFSFTYECDGELKMVEIAGRIISDDEIQVPVPAVKGSLKEIRYLWSNSPYPVTLYAENGLPAAPFTAVVPEIIK